VARFEREAHAVSHLNHPNVVTVYEVGESDGLRFIVTEYVEGETLRELLARGPLPTGRALDIAVQNASALSAADEAGVVHRDVKPENVMLRPDGYVKVLDFGLAKLVERGGTRGSDGEAETVEMAHTNPGAVMGTTWYMSPEQARAGAVDERTDVWSLGCVLYEMLAGVPPFVGATPSHVIVSLLEKEPAPLVGQVAGVTPELEAVVLKALRKNRDARYRTMGEMLEDLVSLKAAYGVAGHTARLTSQAASGSRRETSGGAPPPLARDTAHAGDAQPTAPDGPHARNRWTESFRIFDTSAPGLRDKNRRLLVGAALASVLIVGAYVLYSRLTATRGIKAVAVLPFTNVGGSPDTEWLSDGITESLINSLSPAPGLKVMSRNSVFRYKGRGVEPVRAARELGVGAVLTGEVAQRGDDLVVTAELIDARDNTQLWGERYNRKLSDLVSVQEEIAREIAAHLRSRLQGAAAEPKSHTRDSEAYQDYLRGRYFWNKRTEEGFRRAVEFFDRAIGRDPRYALAYAGLADTYALMSDYSIVQPREAMPKARAAAERALELDDSLAEAHTSRAFVRMAYDWQWREAERDFQRAIELSPNYATAHQWYASYLLQVGRFGEALSEIRRAQELDPLAPIIGANAGLYLYYARRYDEAAAQLRKTLAVDDRFGVAHLYMGYVMLQQPNSAEAAIAEFIKARELMGEDPETLAALGHAYAVAGRRADALKSLEALRARSTRGYVSPYFLAIVYAGLGDTARAFENLERSYQDRHPGMILLKSDPRFDPLRKDARLSDLIRRIEQQPAEPEEIR
ncbi:MAG TPA: protein kinase, partial [Pyrinomonadaceae bacterium]|nr:protein kinase [Pyrinomonadaceae bacterium]